MDNSIDSNYIGFFRANRSGDLSTKSNRQAEHGKAENQHNIIAATRTKAIDKAAVNIEFQLFINQLQNHTTLLQSLQQLETIICEELQGLKTVHQKQYHKQYRQANYQSLKSSSVDDVAVKPISQRKTTEKINPFELGITNLEGNPLITPKDLEFFLSNEKTIQDKYIKIRDIIKDHLAIDVKSAEVNSETLFKTSNESLKRFNSQLSRSISSPDYMYNNICGVLDAIFVPIVRVMRFEHTQALDDAINFIATVQTECLSDFHTQMDTIKVTVDCLLFKQYRWCILAEIHNKHIAKFSPTDEKYQSKSVSVYQKIKKTNNCQRA